MTTIITIITCHVPRTTASCSVAWEANKMDRRGMLLGIKALLLLLILALAVFPGRCGEFPCSTILSPCALQILRAVSVQILRAVSVHRRLLMHSNGFGWYGQHTHTYVHIHTRTIAGGEAAEPAGRQNSNATTVDIKQATNNRTISTPAPLVNTSAYLTDRDAPLVNISAYARDRDLRELKALPKYVPHKGSQCGFCAMCKGGNVTDKAAKKCKSACSSCPNAVAMAAESVLNFEVDGILAAQYIRLPTSEASGRALQTDSTNANGVDVVHYSTTWFEGE